jgi:hypothetical protein
MHPIDTVIIEQQVALKLLDIQLDRMLENTPAQRHAKAVARLELDRERDRMIAQLAEMVRAAIARRSPEAYAVHG